MNSKCIGIYSPNPFAVYEVIADANWSDQPKHGTKWFSHPVVGVQVIEAKEGASHVTDEIADLTVERAA